MLRIPVQSRTGNLILAALGVLYSLGAVVVSLRTMTEGVHRAPVELVVHATLVFALVCGIWLVLNAVGNLRPHGRSFRALPHFERR